MENIILIVLAALVCGLQFSKCDEAKVFISQRLGQDTDNCSSKALPCETVNYGYRKALKDGLLTKLDIVIEGSYTMYEPLAINVTHANLTALKIYSNNNTEILGGEHGYISLGCPDVENCVKYTILFENLTFWSFRRRAAVTAFQITGLSIIRCSFVDSNNSALRWINSGGRIENCNFRGGKYNGDLAGPEQVGGAVGLTFHQATRKLVVVTNSSFINNEANVNVTSFRDRSSDALLHFSYFGGALGALFLNSSTSNQVVVVNCLFDGNRAPFGGAVAYSAAGNAMNNSVSVMNSNFTRNFAYFSGGGFFFKAINKASANSLTFRAVAFQRNAARECGGAGRLSLESLDNEPAPVRFIYSTFIENRAQTAAAIGASKTSREPRASSQKSIVFINTLFKLNMNYNKAFNSSLIHTGALAVFKIDVQFYGNNVFLNNKMCPLYVCGAVVNASGSLLFKENYAYNAGGGMALLDGSTLLLMPGANLTFERNYALTVAGALLYKSSTIESEVQPFNPFCFLQYGISHVPASKWNVSLNFIKNGAGLKGSAVYATTLSQCTWTESYPFSDITKALRWSTGFVYRGNYIGGLGRGREDSAIATDTHKYIYSGKKEEYSYPGQVVTLGISAVDELHNSVISVPAVFSTVVSNGTVLGNSSLVISKHLLYLDSNTTNFKYSMQSQSDYEAINNHMDKSAYYVQVIDYLSIYGARVVAKMNPTKCAPGYKFDSTRLDCVCDQSIHGLTRCNGTMIRLSKGIWGNVSQSNPNKLVTFQCPRHYCKCNTGDSFQSDCELDPKKADSQCTAKRGGMLCGSCREGASITLPSYSCMECGNPAWVVFSIVIVFTVAICLAILYFNPKMSEYMKGIFFYSQILPYVFTGSGKSAAIAGKFSTVVNSVAVGSMPVEMCLFHNIDLIDAIGVSYVIPATCTLVLFVVFVLNKLGLLTLHRSSPFNAFWLLVVVIFKLVVETTMKSMACFNVDGMLLFYYDGSKRCFSEDHLALFVPSVIILAVFVIPTPIAIVLISFGYIRVVPQVSDIIFQSYRTRYRWWLAVDLARRIAFSAVYTFVSDWFLKQMLFLFLTASVCLTHVIAQPYRNALANHGESFLLVSLCLVAALQGMSADEELRETGSSVVIICTIIYTAAVVCILAYHQLLKVCQKWRKLDVDEDQQTARDLDGAPYFVPERAFLRKKRFWSRRRGSDDDDKTQCTQSQVL